MKKIFLCVLMVILVSSTSFAYDTKSLEYNLEQEMNIEQVYNISKKSQIEFESLNSEEISEKEINISQKYSVGDKLSKQDQDFILLLKQKVDKNISLRAGYSTKFVNQTSNGATVTGTMWQDIMKNGTTNNLTSYFEFDAYLRNNNSGTTTSLSLNMHHVAYGLAGSGGMLKIFEGSTGSSNRNTSLLDVRGARKSYDALAVVYTTNYLQGEVVQYSSSWFVTSPTWSSIQ